MKNTIPKTMKAAALDRFGGPETLKVRMLPVPEAGPGEILLRVDTAGIGVWDPFECEGGFAKMLGMKPKFPYVPGSDGAGTVVAVGEGVTQFRQGDRVYAMSLANPKGGFYAEYAAPRAEHAARVPGRLPLDQAGAMPADAVTALRGLVDTLSLKNGESLLIFGASGGIGHIAIQLARRMGVRVLAAASGDDGITLAARLGADVVVDGHKADVAAAARTFAPEGLDAALFTAGGKEADAAMAGLRRGGRAAHPNGVEPEPQARPGVTLRSYDGMPDPGTFERLNRLIEAGPFEVHIAAAFTLEQATEAHRALEKHFLGKLALRPE